MEHCYLLNKSNSTSNTAAATGSTVPVYQLPLKPEPMIITDQEELDMIISELTKNNFLSEKVSIIPDTVNALLSANSNDADSYIKAAAWVTSIDTMNVKQDVIARFVLATIYYMNGGVSWNNSTNWMSAASYHCDWYGVNCCEELFGSVVCEFDSFGQVTELDLYRNNVSGPIPTSVVLLPYLHAMYLNENSLTGHIPATELASMPNFGKLYAQYNYLNGTISQDWKELSSIDTMHVHGNNITDTWPSTFCPLEIGFDALKISCTCPDATQFHGPMPKGPTIL